MRQYWLVYFLCSLEKVHELVGQAVRVQLKYLILPCLWSLMRAAQCMLGRPVTPSYFIVDLSFVLVQVASVLEGTGTAWWDIVGGRSGGVSTRRGDLGPSSSS